MLNSNHCFFLINNIEITHKNKINISFRSKGDGSIIDVNKIASIFGGGGHTKASGCVINGSLGDVKKKVLDKIEEVLKNRD